MLVTATTESRIRLASRIDNRPINARKTHFGNAAQREGLRKGMLALGTTAKRDFVSMYHFHAWWRFTRKVGETVGIVLWEDSQERVLELEVVGD